MPVYMVERDLPGIKMEQLAAAQKAAIETSDKFTADGKAVRYIRTTFVPGEAHCMCLFEAANPELVKEVNDAAQIPYTRVVEALDLKDAIHVGHSTGGGEVARYIGRYGSKRVAKAVLISAVPPLMLKTEKNPGGLPMEVFDSLRAAYVANRPQFYKDITLPFYGYNRPGAKISEGIREHWWLQGMMGGVKAHYDCIKAFSETDFTEDLKKIEIPVLVMHGDDDQIVPIGAAGLMSAKILKNATLKVYPGFPHGMPTTNADQINADLLAFVQRSHQASA